MAESSNIPDQSIDYTALSPTELKKLAEKGDPDAQVAYADHLQKSWGDRKEQLNWLSKAYMQGNIIAAWKMGCLYDTDHDYETAMVWYERAAEGGLSIAMMSIVYLYLARMPYHSHIELLAGYETAFAWLIKATQQGNAHAYRTFADFCFFGVQVDQDLSQAIRYYERAAEAGDDMASIMLWYCNKKGKGTPRDKQKADYWFGKCRKINLRPPLRHHLAGWKKVLKRYKGKYQIDVSSYIL